MTYDAVIIGAGHNGLVTAGYLQRAGLKVCVVEKNPWVGGAAVSRELYPGFTYSNCSYVSSLFRPEIMRDLDLPKHDNASYLNTLPVGEVCAVNNWSGDYAVAAARAAEAGLEVNLAYFVPRTGAPAWFDLWCIPTDAPNVENAHQFINYLLRPKVAADFTTFTGYATANAAAKPLLDPAIASDPAIFPDADVMARLFTPAPQTEEQDREITRMWTEVKSGG